MNEHVRTGPAAWIGQALLYGVFAVIVGVFSRWPPYQHLAPDRALLKLSFNHQGKPVSECRRATDEELAKLPANMRAPMRCPRERSPITVELDVDGRTALRCVARPSGLSHDGASAVYHRIELPAGTHQIAVRVNDDARASGFGYAREAAVNLRPAQILVIDFNPEKGGITFK
jgi:hypothetical protein